MKIGSINLAVARFLVRVAARITVMNYFRVRQPLGKMKFSGAVLVGDIA